MITTTWTYEGDNGTKFTVTLTHDDNVATDEATVTVLEYTNEAFALALQNDEGVELLVGHSFDGDMVTGDISTLLLVRDEDGRPDLTWPNVCPEGAPVIHAEVFACTHKHDEVVEDVVTDSATIELDHRHPLIGLVLLSNGTQKQITNYLQWNDGNGCYTDYMRDCEGVPPLTLEQARQALISLLGEG